MYQVIILGCILLVTLNILKHFREPKLNMPPLVPYKIPIIGHTISYMFNSEDFFKQCRKEHGDIFSLFIWGQVTTFVGKEHLQEVLVKDDSFDFGKALRNIFPSDLMFKSIKKSDNMTKEIKDYVLSKLGFYTERMQKSLYSATQKHIGDCDEPKTIYNIYNFMTKIISTPIANICIGEEETESDVIITTFAKLTSDAARFFVIPPFLDFIYPGLQNYVNRTSLRLGLYNPVAKHRRVLIKHIKNQVEKRLREKQLYDNSWKRPNDLLQDLIEEENFDVNNINYSVLSDKICIVIFSSVHTTSSGCADVIMDLASRPEYIQELYEEQLEIHKQADENGILPFEALNEMKKLDSFVRESLRLSENTITIPHVVLKDYTFSNGLQIPKGHMVQLYADDVYQDESLQGPNPKSFEPFRHLNKNVSATKIGKNYVIFGGGKHACPGRHFAVNEIKFFMHNVILRYNFRTESGKIEEKRRVGPITLTSNNGIIFEKRVK